MLFGIVSLVAQPFWGFMADKLTKDRQIIGGCCASGALLYGIFIFSGGVTPLVIVTAVMMQAVFIPMMHLIDSYVSKLILDGYQINYSATRAGGSLSYSVTAFLFGQLITFMGLRYTPLIGMRIAPAVYLGFLIINLLTLWKMPDTHQTSTKKSGVSLRAGVSYLRHNHVFVAYVAAYILMSITNTPMNTFSSVVVMGVLKGNESNVGMVYALQAICELPVMLSFTWVMKKTRIRPAVFMIIGLVFYSLKSVSFAYAPNLYFVYLGSMLHGLSFAVFLPASVAFLMENVRREYLASAQMLSIAIGSAPMSIVMNRLGGMLADYLGPQQMLKLVWPAALLGALVILIWGGALGHKKEDNFITEEASV